MFNKQNQFKKSVLFFALFATGLSYAQAQQEQVKGATQDENGKFLSGVSIKALIGNRVRLSQQALPKKDFSPSTTCQKVVLISLYFLL
ncbi:hypothetical protein KO02_10415 [Sphingobacterium sp. ML3W]|uniref:hypothetical protein n=1 Tax=Sphingobacterium sp. ML3W TaxID=1538644 RepID=UPI0004F86237|nr:hypothetical protein [Sphingobacterium sp. ML3W]AIM37062.1 hypothetical protein KO02_10415 [Sphingobacterium sp. ML3W]